jgi:hypothetical protein
MGPARRRLLELGEPSPQDTGSTASASGMTAAR